MKILVTGGCRSGKSTFARRRAEALGPARRYLATAEPIDEEMQDRILRHQAERDESWTTCESPIELAPHLQEEGVVLVDCLTIWLANVLFAERDPDAERERLVAALRSSPASVVLVTNEVGMGIVPENALARRFRDHAGWLAQAVAGVCDEVWLCAAGIPLRLK